MKKLNLVSERRGNLVYFEEKAALVDMAVLAKYLADNDTHYTISSTDLVEYEQFNFQAEQKEKAIIPCLRVEFRDILRVPSDDVDIRRIIDFRLKRNSELLSFRHQVLDKFQDDLQKAGDKNEIKDETIRFKGQVEKGIRDLDLLLKEAKFQTVTGTLKTIFKPEHVTTALTTATVAGVATGLPLTTLICSIAGLASGVSVEILDFFVSRKNTKREKLAANSYSYLYSAEREFGKARK